MVEQGEGAGRAPGSEAGEPFARELRAGEHGDGLDTLEGPGPVHATMDAPEAVAAHVLTMPFDRQLELFRLIGPSIVACVQGREREELLRRLDEDVRRLDAGEGPARSPGAPLH